MTSKPYINRKIKHQIFNMLTEKHDTNYLKGEELIPFTAKSDAKKILGSVNNTSSEVSYGMPIGQKKDLVYIVHHIIFKKYEECQLDNRMIIV